jgi:hypothetical protein
VSGAALPYIKKQGTPIRDRQQPNQNRLSKTRLTPEKQPEQPTTGIKPNILKQKKPH